MAGVPLVTDSESELPRLREWPGCHEGSLEEDFLHHEQLEIARMAGHDIILNATGDPLQAHAEGIAFIRRAVRALCIGGIVMHAARHSRVMLVSPLIDHETAGKLFVQDLPSMEEALQIAYSRARPRAQVAVVPKGPFTLVGLDASWLLRTRADTNLDT